MPSPLKGVPALKKTENSSNCHGWCLAARYGCTSNRAFSSTFRRRRQRRRMAPRASRMRGTRGRCTAPTAWHREGRLAFTDGGPRTLLRRPRRGIVGSKRTCTAAPTSAASAGELGTSCPSATKWQRERVDEHGAQQLVEDPVPGVVAPPSEGEARGHAQPRRRAQRVPDSLVPVARAPRATKWQRERGESRVENGERVNKKSTVYYHTSHHINITSHHALPRSYLPDSTVAARRRSE